MSKTGHALASEWQKRFADVMEAMADVRPAMEVTADPPSPGPDVLWWKQSLDAGPGAAVWLGAREAAWSALGQKLLAAAGIESPDQQEQKSTYLEIVRQSMSPLATAIGAQLGREVLCTDGAEEEPLGGERFGIAIGADSQTLPSLILCISRELLEIMPGVEAPPVEESTAEEPARETLGLSQRALGTLNLLLDVEMPVSVSFGRTQVRMQEVLRLITGSIIELDRSIAEPVDVIVNNCVVARGEVVVVDGNYGVRIQEVMSRTERLRETRKYLLPVSRA